VSAAHKVPSQPNLRWCVDASSSRTESREAGRVEVFVRKTKWPTSPEGKLEGGFPRFSLSSLVFNTFQGWERERQKGTKHLHGAGSRLRSEVAIMFLSICADPVVCLHKMYKQ